MIFKETELKDLIETTIETGKLLFSKNYIAACDGNISFKHDDKIYITKSGSYLWDLDIKDFAVVTITGDTITGKPSSELPLHLRIYQNSNTKAVIHAHPVHAIAYSILDEISDCLPDNILSELAICAGYVPIVKFAQPGTEAIADSIEEFIGKSKNIILSKHGVLSYGDSLREAFFGVNRVDHTCEILLKAMSAGTLTKIDDKDVKMLWDIRNLIGNISR